MFCSNCGSKVEENEIFCMNCGAKIEQEETLQNNIPSKISSVKLWKVSLCSLICPVAIGLTVLMTSGFSKYSIPVGKTVTTNVTSTHVESSVPKNSISEISYYASASSHLELRNQYYYYPENVCDNNNSTAWFEGVDGNGSGEWIQLDFDGTYELSGVSIVNGWAKNEEKYYNESRLKKALIECDNGFSMEVNFNDGVLTPQNFYFNNKIETTFIRVKILETYKGDDDLYTAISEIKVF